MLQYLLHLKYYDIYYSYSIVTIFLQYLQYNYTFVITFRKCFHKKFGPRSVQPFLTFIGYKQTDTQTDKQTDKPNLYIDFEHNSRKTKQSIRNPKNSNFRIPISLHHDVKTLRK